VRTSRKRLARLLLAPLIYVAALVLLLEDWLWDLGSRLIACIASWPPLARLESHIRALSPYQALALFLLPAILLFPVKLVALYAITQGHALAGVTVILIAKLGGAAAVARCYSLTRPTLLSLPWFARWHDAFMAFKTRWVGRLRESRAMRLVRVVVGAIRRRSAVVWANASLWRARLGTSKGPLRKVRRIIAMWRAARRR
jgi:hypothetical protein